MGWHFTKAAACAALAFSLFSPTFAIAADPMGSVVAVEGRPTAAGPAGARPLSAGSDLFEGDTVVVGDGNAQLQLDDGTKIVVGPSSRLILQAYLRRNSTTASKVGIKALRGTFRFITGKSPKSAYNINTSNATIGIRGTGFDFRVNNRTLIAVIEGAVRLRGSNGISINVRSGCNVAEAGGGAVKARALTGQRKATALGSELPYILKQSQLADTFQLQTSACLTSLGSNESSPNTPNDGTSPAVRVVPPMLGLGAIGAVIVSKPKKFVSPESATGGGQCTPIDQPIYHTVCPNPCAENCGYPPGQLYP